MASNSIARPYRVKDIAGQKFNRLTALRFVGVKPSGEALWECSCDCGSIKITTGTALRKGESRSCGCLLKDSAKRAGLAKVKNIAGQKFGTLTAIECIGRKAKGRGHYWRCQCECGKVTEVSGSNLRSGAVASCGCVANKATSLRNRTHGHTEGDRPTRVYRIWQCMLTRCYNPDRANWQDYGGRGIKVCDRWRESFENFYADMGEPPTPKHTLDRYPDNGGDYGPNNCRWATMSQQARNRRSTRMIEYQGRTMAISDWADEYGIKLACLTGRLNNGWDIEKALTTPVGSTRARMLTFRGESKSLSEWSRLTGIRIATIHQRLGRGWSTEKALTTPTLSDRLPIS